MLFIYNQLLQANQIYIFSLIPILASLLHKNLKFDDNNKKFVCLGTIFLIVFVSIKFHIRFNIDRKFHDLENIDKSKAIQANSINENFKNLKWISKSDQPENELKVIKEIKFPHSLGLLYSAFTYYIGFKVNSGEYKLMGLAPYGEPIYVDKIKENLISIADDGSFQLNMNYLFRTSKIIYLFLEHQLSQLMVNNRLLIQH